MNIILDSSFEEERVEYEQKMKEKELNNFKNISKIQTDWFSKLNDQELESLSFYGKPIYHRKFNKNLRNNILTLEDKIFIKNLDLALEKSILGEEKEVF